MMIGKTRIPRGYRNNNPLNIRKTGERWQGQVVGNDKEFCTFENLVYGWRAALIILMRTYRKRGLKTIKEIIEHWAPDNENDTEAYIRNVVKLTGIPQDKKLQMADYQPVVKAMARFENGFLNDEGLSTAYIMVTNGLGDGEGRCPGCLEVEPACNAIDIENLSSEIDVG